VSSVLLQLLRRSSSPCLLRALWRSARRPGRQERQSRSAPRAATCGTPIVGRPTRRQTTVSADERAANTVRWQVFGLVGPTGRMAPVTYWPSLPGSLLTRAVGSSAVPPHHRVRLGRRSFPLTAAGQSQILTGFPLASPVHRHRQPGEPAAGDTICDPLLQCQHHILGRRVGVSAWLERLSGRGLCSLVRRSGGPHEGGGQPDQCGNRQRSTAIPDLGQGSPRGRGAVDQSMQFVDGSARLLASCWLAQPIAPPESTPWLRAPTSQPVSTANASPPGPVPRPPRRWPCPVSPPGSAVSRRIGPVSRAWPVACLTRWQSTGLGLSSKLVGGPAGGAALRSSQPGAASAYQGRRSLALRRWCRMRWW
jgi:hypothetical protein